MRGVFILAVVLVATIAPATCQRPWWRGQPIKRLGLGQQQQFRPNGQRQQQFRPNNQWMQQQDPEAAQEMREQMAEQAEQEAEAAEELREQEEERAQKLQEQQAEAAEREAQYAQQMREQQAEYGQQNAFAAQGMHQQDTEAAQELAEEEAEAAEELREQQAEADAEAAQNMYQGEAGQEMEQEQDAEAAQEMAEQEEEAAQELAEQEAEDAEEAAELEAEAAEAEAEAMEDLQEAEAEAAEADAEAMGEQGGAAEGAGEGQGGSLGTSFSLGGSNYGPSMGSGSAGPSFYDPTGGFGGSGGSGGSVSFSYGGYQGASGGQNGGQGGAMGATGGAGGGAGAGPGDIPGGGNIGSNGPATGGVAAGAGNSPTNGVNTGGANGAAPDGAANSPTNGVNTGGGRGATSNGTTTSNGATYPPKGGATNGTANGATGATGSTGMNGNGGAGTQATAGNSQGPNSGNSIPSVADGVGQSIGSSFTETTNVGARNEPNIAFAPAPIAQAPDAQLTPAETAALDNTYMDKHLCGGFLGANGISGQKSLAVLALDYAGMKQALNPCNVPKNGRTTGRTPVNIAFRSGMETHGQDPASAVLRDLPGMIQRYGQTPRKVHLFSWHMPSEHALRSLLTKKRRGGLANVDVALGYVKESKMALFSALLGDTTFTNLLGQLQQAGISVNRVCDTCSQIANMTNWQRKRQGLVNGVDVFDQQAGQCGPVAEVPATDQLALGTPQCKSFQESMGSCVFDQLTAACPWLRHSQGASEQPLTSIMERWSTECGKNLSCWQEKGGYLSFLARSAASCSISQYGASSAIGQCVGAAQNAPLDPAPPTPSM
nr:homeotic protein female sterile-like [Lytechinus pictus]